MINNRLWFSSLTIGSILVLSSLSCSNSSPEASVVSSSEADAGFLTLPKATCAGQICLPKPTSFVANPLDAYNIPLDLNTNVIPTVNTVMADVYNFAQKIGLTDCASLAAYPDSLKTIGDETFAFMTSSRLVPSEFPNANSTFTKRIRYVREGDRVAELEVRCGSDTAADPPTFYVRLKRDGLQAEFYYQKFSNQTRLMGASILPNLNRMIAWFKTNDGNLFSMEAARRIGLEEQHYAAKGYRAGQRYLISNELDATKACLNSSASVLSPTSCTFSLDVSPPPAVTNQSAWSNIDVVSFTILDP